MNDDIFYTLVDDSNPDIQERVEIRSVPNVYGALKIRFPQQELLIGNQ